MRALVTGSNSIIGFYIIKELLLRKHNVIAIYNKNNKNINKLKKFKKLVIKKYDIRNSLNELSFLKIKIDVIIHAAADKCKNPRTLIKRKEIFKTNTAGTKNVFKFALKNKIKKFIFFSAISTYGSSLNGSINEKTKQNPIDIYSKTKFLSEQFINNYKKKCEFFILRLPAILGTNGPWISKTIKKIKQNKTIHIYNGDSYYNSCLHLGDLCKIVMKCINNKKKFSGTILNLSSNSKMKIINLIKFIKKKTRSKSKIVIVDNQFAQNYIINNNKLNKIFNFRAMSVKNTINKYLDDYDDAYKKCLL